MRSLIKTSLITLALSFSQIASAEVAVIVNSANNSAISQTDISRIFLGKNKKFASGESIAAVNLKSGNATRSEFEQKVLGKSSKQVKAYWSKLIFSGKAKPLKELDSDQSVIDFVASTPNAIGYIDAAKVSSSVKVVSTIQ